MPLVNEAVVSGARPDEESMTKDLVSPFKPRLLRIEDMREETPDVRTIRLKPLDSEPRIEWVPGQFAEFSVFGSGEGVFTLANSPTRSDFIECSFRAIGKVTYGLRDLAVGQLVGFRGPYGNRFPLETWKGRELVFIGGGIGMVALRSALQWALDHRGDFGEIWVINGARTVADLCYKDEMPVWAASPNVRLVRTVDPGGETPDWDGEVGLLPQVFEALKLDPRGRVVVTCGPPVMLHFLFLSLKHLGYSPEQVVTTLENKMKCGLGLCGRCNVGRHFVCVDGPVFTWAQLLEMPKDY
jgi:sulfhydrogenase subunit gamma (sulfur reductase)